MKQIVRRCQKRFWIRCVELFPCRGENVVVVSIERSHGWLGVDKKCIFLARAVDLCELDGMPPAKRKTPAHVTMASLLIGTMAAGMAIVQDTAGFWTEWDLALNAWTAKLGDGLRDAPRAGLLVAVVSASYLLPMLLLRTPLWWRRVVLWVSFLLVGLAWWPVLALAAWKIEPCMPVAALLWSGFCAMIYAQRHQLPCEKISTDEAKPHEAVREAAGPTQSVES